MCGISGAVSTRRGIDLEPVVARIVRAQHKRGPDAAGQETIRDGDTSVTLGHNRLSIIDVVKASNQPMTTADGCARLSFNGAIYNFVELREELQGLGHIFKTSSDTEVILHSYLEWGESSFQRLHGMFAFALHDHAKRRLYLVRDRFGVKPLYLFSNETSLIFASTPGEIASWAGLKPNLGYVLRGLEYKYFEDSTDICPFNGLHSALPGHFIKVELLKELNCSQIKYYDINDRVSVLRDCLAGSSPQAYQDDLLARLERSCQIRLRADVPVGISVSGGLDSSSIAAIAAGLDKGQLPGISFGLPGVRSSEGPLVEKLSKRLNMPVDYVWPETPQEIEALFWSTLKAQGAPFPHTSVMAQHAVFRRSAERGLKVMLGGQGGDEALMGYRKFFLFQLQDMIRNRNYANLPDILSNAIWVAPAIAGRAKVFWDERRRYQARSAGMGTRLLLGDVSTVKGPALEKDQSLETRQRLDITTFSLPTLLRYEDRNSMANSIESRLPFMDHHVLEFGLAVPTHMKLRRGRGKDILRRAMAKRIPDDIRMSRDKRGFDTQQDDWIREGLGNVLRTALHERAQSIKPYLGQGGIDELFSDTLLVSSPQTFKEAVALLWLSDPYSSL